MSTPVQSAASHHHWPGLRHFVPTWPQAFSSLLPLVVIALFLHTFVLQPFLIPSESMERTLLVGDFLLVNKQVYAPAGRFTGHFLPYRDVERGDVIVFHFPEDPKRYLVKRVVGIPGDRLRIEDGRVTVNGVSLDEPYAAFEPAPFESAASKSFRDNFPAAVSTLYPDSNIDADWWREIQKLTRNGDLVVPPGHYFVLGDNRNHSNDSRFWGLVSRQAIVARPLVIYFSLTRPSTTDVQEALDDKLGHDRELSARLVGFARWKRIFRVVH